MSWDDILDENPGDGFASEWHNGLADTGPDGITRLFDMDLFARAKWADKEKRTDGGKAFDEFDKRVNRWTNKGGLNQLSKEGFRRMKIGAADAGFPDLVCEGSKAAGGRRERGRSSSRDRARLRLRSRRRERKPHGRGDPEYEATRRNFEEKWEQKVAGSGSDYRREQFETMEAAWVMRVGSKGGGEWMPWHDYYRRREKEWSKSRFRSRSRHRNKSSSGDRSYTDRSNRDRDRRSRNEFDDKMQGLGRFDSKLEEVTGAWNLAPARHERGREEFRKRWRQKIDEDTEGTALKILAQRIQVEFERGVQQPKAKAEGMPWTEFLDVESVEKSTTAAQGDMGSKPWLKKPKDDKPLPTKMTAQEAQALRNKKKAEKGARCPQNHKADTRTATTPAQTNKFSDHNPTRDRITG